MSRGSLILALLVVLVIVLIAGCGRCRSLHRLEAADGATVALDCAANQAMIDRAVYLTADGLVASDVTHRLRDVLSTNTAKTFAVDSAGLEVAAGGKLILAYRCGRSGAKSGFTPIPVSPCGTVGDDYYGVDTRSRGNYAPRPYRVDGTHRNAAGTVVRLPYSSQSKVSLERYADSPENATEANPITGVGKTSVVRRMGDRFRRNAYLNSDSVYDLAPGKPGYMEEIGDGVTHLSAKITRRSPPGHGKASKGSSCSLASLDSAVDTEFITDGKYGDAAIGESFTSTRPGYINTLTASGTGLGSIRQDPRFEPGPPGRVPGGDAQWSPGGDAGGPNTAYAPSIFAPPASWNTLYVSGFGDGQSGIYDDARSAEIVAEEPHTLL